MIGLEVEGTRIGSKRDCFRGECYPQQAGLSEHHRHCAGIGSCFKADLKMPPHEIEGQQPLSDYAVEIVDEELCNRYAGRVITGVTIAESPAWIKKRLEQCGIRSINNIVDITNYMLLEFGHPLHAFDADTLGGNKVIVGTPKTVKGATT